MVTAPWAIATADVFALWPSIAVLFLVAVIALAAAGDLDAAEAGILFAALSAGIALGAILLAVELLGNLPLANALRGRREGLMAWPVAAMAWSRIGWAAVAMAAAVILLLALGDSLTGWVAVGAGAVAFGLVAWTGRRGAQALGLAAAIAVLAVPLAPQLVTPERMEQALEGVRPSAIHRIYTWEGAVTVTGWCQLRVASSFLL